jgi:glucose/arabinose dehydrogenase
MLFQEFLNNIVISTNGMMISLWVFTTTGLAISLLVSPPVVEDFILVSAGLSADLTSPSYPFIKNPNFKIQVVTNDIESPTTMDFLNDDILVLEKNSGFVKRIVNGNTLSEPLLYKSVLNQSERGMLGIATVKDQINNKVFLYFTEKGEEDEAHNRIYRYDLVNNKLVHPELVLDLVGEPGARHNGGVLKIGPDQLLYFAIGDVNDGEDQARNQDTEELAGIAGIMRIEQSGARLGILGEEYPLDLYYAYGIRNSFGIDFDPLTGYLWDTENGERNNDEINLVQPGFNSGFNQVQGMNYSKDKFTPENLVEFEGKGKYSDPEFVWNYTVGPTALKFLTSDKYGQEFQNDLFVGDFNNGYLYHFDLNEDRTGLELSGKLKDRIADTPHELEDAVFGKQFGPITDIKVGPDGLLYVLSLARIDDESGLI